MIREVKQYMCEFDYTPSVEDIMEAINLANKNNCIIKLVWRLKYSGEYSRFIYPSNTFDDIKKSLPTIYGV